MKANIKFMKMFCKLPEQARSELVFDYAIHPMSLSVCWLEIKEGTKLGKEILKRLGYKND